MPEEQFRQYFERCPCSVLHVDRTRFAQVLMNLGSNAIKYNRPNGRVTFTLTLLESGQLRIHVRDTGIGIPADKQPKMFQPFQRAGQETGPIEGTGIGLVITRNLVDLMDGSIGFESVAGVGSEFWVDMPLVAAEPEARSVVQAERSGRADSFASEGPRLVLYVEDNPANVSFMRDLMSSLDNVDLLSVPTAELGVELARARRPALILMDINLPGMSGIEALQRLRAHEATLSIPVIALTAAASERDQQLGTQAGFYRYLTKPVKVDDLLEAMEGVLSNQP